MSTDPSPTDSSYSSTSAPLPSPSTSQPSQNYFPSHYLSQHRRRSSTSIPQTSKQAPTSQPQTQGQQQFAQQQQQQALQRCGQGPLSNGKEKDFCLVAEAAKRAQMAVLMRDMGEVALWFAYISDSEECLLEDVLVAPAHGLAKQVHDHFLPKLLSHDPNEITTEQEITARNRLFNVDGFGVAWYTAVASEFNADGVTVPHPALYKNAQPPLHDLNFRSICANTSSKAVFAHIRAATDTPVAGVNNHPFVFGRHTFMHNGMVSDFVSICRDMVDLMDDDAYANIHGSTDSEHFAALYITYLTGGKGKASWEKQYTVLHMRDAMRKVVGTVVELQRKKLGAKAQPNSLNLAATDGSQLVAFRFRNHATEQPPSLYYSTKAGVTLNRKYPNR
ncbi:hypothetical protein MMC21_000092 [Puttea exsequens]|nr:hypothetical protein [Puttea exsequens]